MSWGKLVRSRVKDSLFSIEVKVNFKSAVKCIFYAYTADLNFIN